MKIEVKNKEYNFITDDSRLVNEETAFLITEHNQKYFEEVKNKTKFFLKPEDLFKEWNLDKIKIVGITGTNGKTTTTNIIAYILKNNNFKVAVSGTEGVFLHTKNEIKKIAPRTQTTPDVLVNLFNLKTSLEAGADFFVMEVSSHGIFQNRIEGLKFDGKIFTNLTQDHLDFHKTMEEYARVKSSFFQDEVLKIINLDDDWIQFNPKNAVTYSLKKDADFKILNASFKNKIWAELLYKDKVYEIKSKMIGKFNLYNLLGGIALVKKLTDLDLEKIIKSAENFTGVAGRMEILFEHQKADKKIEVFSDYAHTPDAIEKVLNSLDKNSKIISLIGAGGDRDKSKRPLMAEFAAKNSDFVFLTSDNPRTEKPENILKDMEEGVKEKYQNYEIILDRKEAIKKALKKAEEIFKSGDSVFVAILGKGDEDYIDINNQKIPYSDREEVKNYKFDL